MTERLLLFDIDQTLLNDNSCHKDAFAYAFKKVYGLDTTIDIILYHGMTDQQIILETLKKNRVYEPQIRSRMKEAIDSMAIFYDNVHNDSTPEVLPGVRDLLDALQEKGYALGIVTGNLEKIGRAKLASAGLNSYFKIGSFGSDDISRTNLVRIAIERAELDYGFKKNDDVSLFGDSPQDMIAGKEAGVLTIGVGTGVYLIDDLMDAGAKYAVPDLRDTMHILDIIGEPSNF